MCDEIYYDNIRDKLAEKDSVMPDRFRSGFIDPNKPNKEDTHDLLKKIEDLEKRIEKLESKTSDTIFPIFPEMYERYVDGAGRIFIRRKY